MKLIIALGSLAALCAACQSPAPVGAPPRMVASAPAPKVKQVKLVDVGLDA
ncbi:MAG: hypothetical protein JRH20_27070, partial [Deltaproteobacteria bacterium]|nr:hypothetical protein [Deltaproteobacteria bacterium]